jgi:hypothetical protein
MIGSTKGSTHRSGWVRRGSDRIHLPFRPSELPPHVRAEARELYEKDNTPYRVAKLFRISDLSLRALGLPRWLL